MKIWKKMVYGRVNKNNNVTDDDNNAIDGDDNGKFRLINALKQRNNI